jgi:TonB family protein
MSAMSSFSGLAASCLANSVWEAALVAAAGYLVSRLVNRLGPQFEHTIWVATLIISVVTPALPFLRGLTASLIAVQSPGQHASTILIASQNGLPDSRPVFVLPQAVLWPFLALYGAAILYFAVRLVGSLLGASALLRKAGPASLTPEQVEIWRRCKRSFSLDKAQLLASPVSGPVALGLRSPILLLPDDFPAKCAPQDFLAALSHECAHLKRRDFQKNLFYEAVSLPLCFHPAIWAIKAQVAQTREMVCDAMVMERHMDARSYSRSLLRLATMVALAARVPAIHPIGIFDANILEKRIMRISVKKHQASAFLKYTLLFPAVLNLLSAALTSAAMAVVIEPQSPARNATQNNPYGPVYKVGKDVTAPVVLKSVEAKFPKSAHDAKKGFRAIVLVRLVVDAEGSPRDVQISRSYNADFDAEAIKAVQQYLFKPAMKDGKPVAVAIIIETDFGKY